jgi:sugar (pentulose or hexulose) kinase
MADYLAGVDVGTTGARCMIFDLHGNPVARHYCDYGATILGRVGWNSNRNC